MTKTGDLNEDINFTVHNFELLKCAKHLFALTVFFSLGAFEK